MNFMEYKADKNKIKEGLEELLRERINQIINHGGPFTLANALDNYTSNEQLAIRFGVSTLEYNKEVNDYLKEHGFK